jgi:hypothetical protein
VLFDEGGKVRAECGESGIAAEAWPAPATRLVSADLVIAFPNMDCKRKRSSGLIAAAGMRLPFQVKTREESAGGFNINTEGVVV